MLLGVMGKIGSGKSTCVKYLYEIRNFIVYDCDSIAKIMIDNNETEYIKSNPVEFFTNENLQEKCRNTLHKQVFNKIFDEYKDEINKNPNVNAVIETALPNQDFLDMCDKTILIDNDLNTKFELLSENRNYGIGKTKLIFNSQKYYEKFYDKADYKIDNNGTEKDLINKFKGVIDEIYFICK